MKYALVFAFCASYLPYAASFRPQVVPLAQKNPYLNTWIKQGDDGDSFKWPMTWSTQTLGHAGLISVDGTTYTWFGNVTENNLTATMTDVVLTPSSTILQMQAGGIDFNATFLSPIDVTDMVSQSYPFTYIYLDMFSNDGLAHNVHVYMDISGEWLTNQTGSSMGYVVNQSSKAIWFWALQDHTDWYENEDSGTAEDGSLFLIMEYDPMVTYDVRPSNTTRNSFIQENMLSPLQTVNSGAPIDTSNHIVCAFSKAVGDIQTLEHPIVFGLGLSRKPVLQIAPKAGQSALSLQPLWTTHFSEGADHGLDFFMSDFKNACTRALDLDNRIVAAAKRVSQDLVDLVSYTTRSIMASMEFTFDGSHQNVMIFSKGLGSIDHNKSRITSSVHNLYAAWPGIMFLNATYGQHLLRPLLRFQSNNSDTYAYSSLGNQWPIISSEATDANLAIENSSSMLLMVMACTRFSNDTSIIKAHYSTLKRWADGLISSDVVNTPGATSGDGIRGDGQANLALKGIFAIRAMGQIAYIYGDNEETISNYISTAHNLLQNCLAKIYTADGQILARYDDDTAHALLYNLYQHDWLGLEMTGIATLQTGQAKYIQEWMDKNNESTSPMDLPFNTDDGDKRVFSHWTMWTASFVTDKNIRDQLISGVSRRAQGPGTSVPGTGYWSKSGARGGGEASITFGGHFAPMALELPVLLETKSAELYDPDGSRNRPSPSHIGATVGGVVGGVVALAVPCAVFFFVCRRRKQRKEQALDSGKKSSAQTITPYDPGLTAAVIGSSLSDQKRPRPTAQLATRMAPSKRRWHNLGVALTSDATAAVAPVSTALEHAAQAQGQVVTDMREQIERLEREMQEIRAAGVEAPPSYR